MIQARVWGTKMKKVQYLPRVVIVRKIEQLHMQIITQFMDGMELARWTRREEAFQMRVNTLYKAREEPPPA